MNKLGGELRQPICQEVQSIKVYQTTALLGYYETVGVY